MLDAVLSSGVWVAVQSYIMHPLCIYADVSHQDGPDSISSHSDAPISPNEQSVGNAPSVEVNSSTHSDDVDGISQDPNIFLHGIHIKHEPTGEASIEQQADGNSNGETVSYLSKERIDAVDFLTEWYQRRVRAHVMVLRRKTS